MQLRATMSPVASLGVIMGFDHKHYVPILKGKSGELRALAEIDEAIWESTTPLIDLPAIPLEWPEGGGSYPKYNIATHADRLVKLISKFVPEGQTIFIDGIRLENEEALEDGRESIEFTLSELAGAGILAIPVVGLRRVLEYSSAVKNYISDGDSGCCLRLDARDLDQPGLTQRVARLLGVLEVEPDAVDLIIDFAAVDDDEGLAEHRRLFNARLAVVPQLADWRSLTIAMTTMPRSAANIPAFTAGSATRNEWAFWSSIID